jgi:bifunctional non-homologous end joining protein LigD
MRRADRTPEPMGKTPRKARPGAALRFVIQEHHATALHWDLRLERDGVFVSWALPKGLPLTRADYHLAVHTEEHPLEYGSFEGTIPRGEYGAGTVTIWDKGTYEREQWDDKDVKFTLHGERSSGRYGLFKTDGKNWMIHKMDPEREGWEPLPMTIEPMLAQAGPLPTGKGWTYEFKWDGVRAVTAFDGGRPHARSRNGNDLTSSVPELRALGRSIGATQMVLDGELVAMDEQGRPNFGLIQHRLRLDEAKRRTRALKIPVDYVIFDLLHLDGTSLLNVAYKDRRRLLEELELNGERWATGPAFVGANGKEVLEAAGRAGLEGVVAKKDSSLYRPGRRVDSWIKVKFERAQEVVIVGVTEGNGSRRSTFGALLLAVSSPQGLELVGKVGTGFSEEERLSLLAKLRPLERATPPVKDPAASRLKGVTWVRPTLVGEVRFTEWTADGQLRHPTWRGLRRDKRAEEVTRGD